MLSDDTAQLVQAAALFSERRELPLVRQLATKALKVIANAKERAGALALIGNTYVVEGDDDKGTDYFRKAADALDDAAGDARADPFLSNSAGGAR